MYDMLLYYSTVHVLEYTHVATHVLSIFFFRGIFHVTYDVRGVGLMRSCNNAMQ